MKKKMTKARRKRVLRRRKWMKAALLLILLAGIVMVRAMGTREATVGYNNAVREYNRQSAAYDDLTRQTCIDNIEGMPVSFGTLAVESESLIDSIRVMFSQNSREKILQDTVTIRSFIGEIKGACAIARQITAPGQDWVLARLETVEAIRDMQPVTGDNDPGGLLHQAGGYGACIYFTIDAIDPETVDGADIVAKGTDAGGAVEVYRTVEEAQARCDYLADFDGTLLYSGSYAIVGTMVIRTSYMLSDDDQFQLTSQITEALTSRT